MLPWPWIGTFPSVSCNEDSEEKSLDLDTNRPGTIYVKNIVGIQ